MDESAFGPRTRARQFRRYALAIEMLAPLLDGTTTTVIDMGSGTGYGTAALARAFGQRVIGYEPDETARLYAQHAYPEPEFSDQPPDTSGAAVVMIESIEHMPRERAHAALSRARLAFITTIFCRNAANPHHEYPFDDEREVASFLAPAGLQPVEVRLTYGIVFTDGSPGTQYLGLFSR